jgi:hypothetical protein
VKRKWRFEWTRKKVVVLVAVIFLVWLGVSLAIPAWWYGEQLWPISLNATAGHYTLQIGGQPPVSYRANITLSTVRTFAVDNYIHIKAIIYDVNLTDFRVRFEALGFLHAGYGIRNGVIIVPLLNEAGQGVWVAEGDFVFLTQPNATGPMLIPLNNSVGATSVNIPSLYTYSVVNQIDAYNFPLCGKWQLATCAATVEPQDANSQIVTDETNIRNEVILSSFGAVFLQPLLEAVLIPEGKKGKQRKAT